MQPGGFFSCFAGLAALLVSVGFGFGHSFGHAQGLLGGLLALFGVLVTLGLGRCLGAGQVGVQALQLAGQVVGPAFDLDGPGFGGAGALVHLGQFGAQRLALGLLVGVLFDVAGDLGLRVSAGVNPRLFAGEDAVFCEGRFCASAEAQT